MFPPIEFQILDGVDKIEAGHPTDDTGAEDNRRQFEPFALRNPCAGWGDRQGKTEKKMREIGEAFRDGVEKNNPQGDGREHGGGKVNGAGGGDKSDDATDETEDSGFARN